MKRALLASMVVVCIGWVAVPAQAVPTVNYQGSFDIPSSATLGITDYYASRVVFVPDQNTRPGNGTMPTGPSLVIWYNWAHRAGEFSQLPTPSTDSGSIPSAAALLNANGGTVLPSSVTAGPVDVDSAGNFWGQAWSASSTTGVGLNSLPGQYVLGVGSTPSGIGVQEIGWGGSGWPINGVLRRGDGSGGDLSDDGTATGAKFITASHDYSWVYIAESERLGPTNMSASTLFRFSMPTFAPGLNNNIGYVRDTGGDEWFMFYVSGPHEGTLPAPFADSFSLSFFNASTSGDDPTADLVYDIGADIAAGAGWMSSGSLVQYVGVDWANSTLYVLEGGVYGQPSPKNARIHVFTIEGVSIVPEPATLSLLAIGGLAMFRLRRRRHA